ncbi:VOC family protein [Patescibacteria group bacterium]|nr:VOC family protein [Patescibacteria group bacterium]
MIDHLSVPVSDMTSAKAFYLAALAPLGYALMMEGDGYCGIGKKEISGMWDGTIWLGKGDGKTSLHFALRADDRAAVDAFYKAALAAGGKDNGAPGIRAHYHENYYAAFVHDTDGHNIEVVCHGAE